MTFQTAAPLTHRSLGSSNRQAREVARQVANGDLDVNPPYQRPSVWTNAQRMNLVRSWCLGIPVPAIMINDRATHAWSDASGYHPYDRQEAGYVVVDGKQRVETAVAWFDGDLLVPASWFAAEDVETTVETDDGPYVAFTGLSTVRQRLFANRAMLPTIEANASTLAEEADLYVLVNTGGTVQTDADMANAASYGTDAEADFTHGV